MTSDRLAIGIDLGTTNSAVARMRRGKPEVVKNTFQGDTTPSAVSFRRGRIRVGFPAYNQLKRDRLDALKLDRDWQNSFIEFKRTMGTDHESTPSEDPSIRVTSEELSAEMLKELRRTVKREDVRAAVVTIPSAFTVSQQQATERAAELAGIRQCRLLQEPVAAAMAYGLDNEHGNEKWLVFDFGGGTFDAALVLVEDGEITVRDTEGDNHLGGKDLDRAVVEKIILKEIANEYDIQEYLSKSPDRPRLLRKALTKWAEEANILLSSRESHFVESDLNEIQLANGDEIDLDFAINRERLRPVVQPIFQRAIDKAKTLLARRGLDVSDLDELILVGGPTQSPILQAMLAEQIRIPNSRIDPMTIVARGAAFYASTVELNADVAGADPAGHVLRLDLTYEATSISHEEWVSVKCRDPSDCRLRGPLEVEVQRTGTGWRSGRQSLTEGGALLEVSLEEQRANVFDLLVTTSRGDRVETSPSEITINHGTRLTGSPLPNSLGVEVWDETRTNRIFTPLKGAEKSKPLPVTGTQKGLSTDAQIRPGIPGDRLLIRLHEGGSDAEKKPVLLCDEFVMSLELTGDQVKRVIPAGTSFDLTVITQPSSATPETVRVVFPSLDDEEYELPIPSHGKSLQTDWIDDEIAEARKRIGRMRARENSDETAIDDIDSRVQDWHSQIVSPGSGRDAVEKAVSRLKEALRELFDLHSENEWPDVEAELEEAWNDLQTANAEEGHDESRAEVREVIRDLHQVRESQDTSLARQVIGKMKRLTFQLKYCEWSKLIIYWAQTRFTGINWINGVQARMEVDAAVGAQLADKPCPELLKHARRILRLVVQESKSDPRPPIPYL